MFRISGLEGEETRKKPAVMFINGLFGDSNFWFANELHLAPPFLLASRGYDVWLSNTRGSNFAQQHTRFSTDEIEFWQFDFINSGVKELPQYIDFVLEQAGQD